MIRPFWKSRRIGPDTRSSVVLEFALIAPVLILMALGAIEFTAAVRAELNVERSARAVANLISDQTSITPQQLQDYYAAANDMYAGTIGTLTLSAASVTFTNQDANGAQQAVATAKAWDASTAATTPAYTLLDGAVALTNTGTTPGLSDGVDNDSVIIVRAKATYTLPFLPNFYGKIPTALSFGSYAFARPRFVLVIKNSGF
jgi:Flp pilus assembly protein TadG